MSVNGVTPNNSVAPSTSTAKNAKVETKAAATTAETSAPAAVYDKDATVENKKKTYTKDTATINKLLADMENRKKQLQDLVTRTLQGQGKAFNTSQSIYDILKGGQVEFSAEDIAQAKEDVSEDGYWGVEQTSERIYSFAYALVGGDPSKADDMLAAIEKGFKAAGKEWGSDLPDISHKTMDAVREKISNWKNGITVEE